MSSKMPAAEPSSKVRLQKALMTAIIKENLMEVRRCLEGGVNPNFLSPEPEEDHLTPLNTACRHNSPEIVDLLLSANADPNFANAAGETPLLQTIARDLDKEFGEVTDGENLNVEFYKTLFKTSVIMQNDLKIVRALLDAKADMNKADSDDSTPLVLAAGQARLDILLELFKRNASQRLPKDMSIRARALFAFGFRIMRAQLKKNPNATVDDILDYVKKYESFVQKIMGGQGDVAELEQVIQKDDKGFAMSSKMPAAELSSNSPLEAALMHAIMTNRPAEVRGCLDQGVNPNFMATETDETPLMAACLNNSPEIVFLLLGANADPNFACGSGLTPLQVTINQDISNEFAEATQRGQVLNFDACTAVFNTSLILQNNLKIVRALLDAKADMNKPTPNRMITPVFLAVQFLRVDILLELFRRKADTSVPKGIPLQVRALCTFGFGIIKKQLKKNPNATVKDVLDSLKKYESIIQKIMGGQGDIAELEQAIEKDDKALEHYIHALKKVVDEYLSKKTTFAPGKAKLAGAQVFLERLKLLDTMEEARALAIPFSEVFTDKKLAKTAEEMLKNLPKFAAQKNLQNLMITLDDLLSLNRKANKKDEPASLKKFRAAFKQLEEGAAVTKEAPKK